ncbi:uncharacterized protein I206_103439 [Kwoniella pini CBS 10737]|uniref:Uncharacterized protein n=1 Tax=Kwoniella pini CBS 10737 TaxID=1296096 RepID=A0A1B9I9H5_9TREE|nr:uncharacterized protein I206_01558 [Kwoniella pini CBS 10737]OCF52272.1 hypothetical protein I206_01558 [Kwoniella pini CBS 10737]
MIHSSSPKIKTTFTPLSKSPKQPSSPIMPSSGPSSPRLILNSPPLEHHSTNGTTGSYFQQSSNKKGSSSKHPGPLYPPVHKTNPYHNSQPLAGPSSGTKGVPKDQGQGRTPAEAYANLHTQQQSKRQLVDHPHHHPFTSSSFKENQPNGSQQLKEKGTKPVILDWISRKLGARRATISESPSTSNAQRLIVGGSPKLNSGGRNRLPSISRPTTTTIRGGRGSKGGENVGMINMRRENSSNSTQPSLSMYSTRLSNVGTLEREKRREANNPYPSIPIPKLIASSGLTDTIKRRNGNGRTTFNHNKHISKQEEDQENETNTTVSMTYSYSYLSRSPRSRSYSLDSIRSSTNSYARSLDDSARPARFRGRANTNTNNERPVSASGGYIAFIAGGGGLSVGADDDASLRPFPPSHPASPTHSTSVLSRTGSNQFPPPQPSNKIDGSRSRTNTFYSTWSGAGHARSTTGSLDGIYGSTYRYSYDQRREDNEEDQDEEDDGERGRESRQDSTSTKPTTCISFDSSPAIAHIAQPQFLPITQNQFQVQLPTSNQTQTSPQTQPYTPTVPQGSFGLGDVITSSPASVPSPSRRASSESSDHVIRETSSGGSSPTPPSPTTPTSHATSSPTGPISQNLALQVHVQAPKHTPHHPLHNPIPNEIPDDNASMLTLASSTFDLLPNQIGNNQGQSQSESITPQTHITSVIENTSQMINPILPNPTIINRLKDTTITTTTTNTTNQIIRPNSITSPSIHWAPTPNLSSTIEERPNSIYDNNNNNNNSIHNSNHLSTTTSIKSFKQKADRDASVRAIRRKGSWESYESGWSWRGYTNNNKNLTSPIGGISIGGGGGAGGGGGSFKNNGFIDKSESWKSRNDDNDDNDNDNCDDVDNESQFINLFDEEVEKQKFKEFRISNNDSFSAIQIN